MSVHYKYYSNHNFKEDISINWRFNNLNSSNKTRELWSKTIKTAQIDIPGNAAGDGSSRKNISIVPRGSAASTLHCSSCNLAECAYNNSYTFNQFHSCSVSAVCSKKQKIIAMYTYEGRSVNRNFDLHVHDYHMIRVGCRYNYMNSVINKTL